MHRSSPTFFRPLPAAFALGLLGAGSCLAAGSEETAFLGESDAAMTKMMAAMEIKPSGDVDRDFVAMMAPHHQGAIDMAQSELRYGHNEPLRRLAQEIIVTQQQEIAVMRLAVEQSLPPSLPSPDQPAPAAPTGAPSATHHSMHEEP